MITPLFYNIFDLVYQVVYTLNFSISHYSSKSFRVCRYFLLAESPVGAKLYRKMSLRTDSKFEFYDFELRILPIHLIFCVQNLLFNTSFISICFSYFLKGDNKGRHKTIRDDFNLLR